MELDCEQGSEDGEVSPSPMEIKVNNSPHFILQQTRVSIEDIVASILSMKKEGKPKSVLGELVTQMFVHFVLLRQVNRSILIEEDRVKVETERSKSPVDLTTLQLHNLMYEKNHYVKAIKTCKDFKSKYPYIELVSEEEFYKGASEEVMGALMSNDASHNLTLKRLNYELFQRKELCKLHEKLEIQKKKLSVAIADRKKFFSSLPSHLKSLKKVSLPVQQQLGILHTKNLKQYHLAELLPPPLYVIYSQLSAQKEAFGEHIDIEIFGSVKDAQNFACQQALLKRDGRTTSTVDISRWEDEAADEDDDGQRRRKRIRKASGRENIDHSGIYQTHPLKINLHIYDDGGSDSKSGKLVALKFEYLFKLNVVCAGIDGSQSNILCNLFPDDIGLDFPHQTSKLLVGESKFDENRNLRPYKWAQHLAGIDFLPEMAPLLYGSDESKTCNIVSGVSLYRQQNRIQTVVQRIRSRKKSQMALEDQLETLNKLKWPSFPNKGAPWALHTPSCTLHSWSPIGSDTRDPSSYVHDLGKPHDSLNSDHVNGKVVSSKGEVEYAREDGELPDFVHGSASDDVENPPLKMSSEEENSRQMALISKSMVPSIAKSFSFRKQDEENDILIDSDNEVGEFNHLQTEEGDEDIGCKGSADNSWINFGVREFYFVLTAGKDKVVHLKLEAKVKVSMEYPLRPPFFSLTIGVPFKENNTSDCSDFNWFNSLRSIEAEVNLHILEMLPKGEKERVLSHQVRLLALLFDLYAEDMLSGCRERGKNSSVVDVGLCKPVTGNLVCRYLRGRDRRKVISWNDTHCNSGFPS